MSRFVLADGKYEVTNDKGVLTFKRHGMPWQAAHDLAHSGVVLALVHELEKKDAEIKALQVSFDARVSEACANAAADAVIEHEEKRDL